MRRLRVPGLRGAKVVSPDVPTQSPEAKRKAKRRAASKVAKASRKVNRGRS